MLRYFAYLTPQLRCPDLTEDDAEVSSMKKKTLYKVLLTLGVVLFGGGFLFYSSVGNAQHYKMVDDLMKAPGEWVGRDMKVHGWVQPGSIKEQILDQEMHRTFTLQHSGKKIVVTHVGPTPDTFRDQSEVVASGNLVLQKDGTYQFAAKELMAKCPSKYEGAQSNKKLKDPVFAQ
jgi:cytochrome c-type biogenesis protein CcmE